MIHRRPAGSARRLLVRSRGVCALKVDPIQSRGGKTDRRGLARTAPSSGYRRNALAEARLVFAALTLATIGLLALSSGLSGSGLRLLLDPLGWLASLDPSKTFQILSGAAQVVAGVLGIAITVVAIVLELAANRYSHRITWLFVREPVNIFVLSFFVVTTLQCVWVAATSAGFESTPSGGAVLPEAGFVITLAMVTVSLLAVLPYFNFVLAFLSPLNMIEKIRDRALQRIANVRPSDMERTQSAVEEAVDELQDVARSSTEQSDRRVAMATVEALAELLDGYDALRDSLPPEWFEIAPAIAADPDFASLTPSALQEIERSGTWLEVKIMQQYLSLMNECVPRARDIANVIAINTSRIAIGPGRQRAGLRALCIRCMNSYLRTCINAKDPRTTYFIMNQYRLVAEAMLRWGEVGEVMRVAGYLKFYGNLGYTAGMPFLLETASHDLIQLIEADLADEAALTDELLTLLLDLDREMRDESQEESLLGVRRSQMQLATLFLERGDVAHAARIADDLASESPPRLARAREQLEQAEDPQYWEFTARGVNFAYLPSERRARLSELELMVDQARSQRSSTFGG